MKILPPQTLPPGKPTARRHQPPVSSHWSAYRACLRWDFGFTCALCLLHEADLYGGQPGEGLGGTTVEHTTARSEDVSKENDYDNCLYACRFCNRSRSAKPAWRQGTRLLDPTRDGWNEHFQMSGDNLLPVQGNAEAEYTHEAYEIDDPRKVVRRQVRRELVTDRLRLLVRLDGEIAELLRLAGFLRQRDLRKFGEVVQQIRVIQADARRALGDLRRYSAIPVDAPQICRCPAPREHSLPEELDRQTVEVSDSVL